MIYTETDLIIPALVYLSSNKNGATTTQLIKHLIEILKPEGKDSEILNGRNDTHFHQKVRNLVSHKTLENKNLTVYEGVGRGKIHKITIKGQAYVSEHIDGFDFIVSNGFTEEQREEIIKNDFSNLVIEEGYITSNHVRTRARSKRLVELAKKHFSREGKIYCDACEFNFEDRYGELGKGFIEIHHLKPIFSYDDNEEKSLVDALKNVAPVCSNCHRIIHRKRSNILPIETLREMIANRSYAKS